MSKVIQTRLRYISSKDPDKILEYLNKLIGYKVEIKGNTTFAQKKWFLWFVIPEDIERESIFGNLD